MTKCRTCSGELLPLDGGRSYRCLYCGNYYSDGKCSMNPESLGITKMMDHGADVYENNISGVLEITWTDNGITHSGSGFLITDNGYAITNTHVVTHENGISCGRVNIRVNNTNATADVLSLGDDKHGSGKGVDLAIIKLQSVPSGAKRLQIASFEKVRNGERVFVIGNSLGRGTCITSGIVSDRLRNVEGKLLMMTDCAVNGGNSGGPIFNDSGYVIGAIVSGITSAEGMNFAIPSDTIIDFICKNNIHTDLHMATVYSDSDRGPRKSTAPCPRCNSWNTSVENDIFYCSNCGYEG